MVKCCEIIKTQPLDLELLQPHTENGTTPYNFVESDIWHFFASSSISKFIRTGICITVDLDDFSGIECHSPVNAELGVPAPMRPSEKIMKEELSGNFDSGTVTVWQGALPGEYIRGTFQILNFSSNTGDVEGIVTANPSVVFSPVPPGFTISRTAIEPTAFTIKSPLETNGKYCITLYKHVPL